MWNVNNVETELQMEHHDFVSGEEIQDKEVLVDHINFVIPEWFYKIKCDDIPQWLPQVCVRLIGEPFLDC